MKVKSFQEHLEKRLSKKEIAEIEAQARLEVGFLKRIQTLIASAMDEYMKENNVGFNELARKLEWSPSKVSKVRRGESNLTMASLAHLFALLGKEPQEVFKVKK